MGLLVDNTDFSSGKYKIAQGSFSDLTSYIDKYESIYLRRLLGVELYNLFENDVDSNTKQPVTQKFIDIFDPISEDDDSEIRISEGMKEMLKGFIYFEYVRSQKFKNTVSGTVVNQPENAKDAQFSNTHIYNIYNEAVLSADTIQWYINENSSVYPEYNGQEFQITSQY
jgi:hypothetical protein